jgi:hypothetical protein
MRTKLMTLVVLLLGSISTVAIAQTEKKPFVYNLSEDGTRYIKFGVNAQIWGRYTDLNPGSKVGSNVADNTYDLVIRRIRLQALGMLTSKVFFHFQMGNNNLNFYQNTGPYNSSLNVMDALGEYHFNEKIHVGAGLCGWGAGTTRYSAQSSSSQLTLDAPIYQQNNVSGTYGNRNFSLYAKGQISNFNYRVAVTNPYRQSSTAISKVSAPSPLNPSPQFLGMLTYNFLEKESIAEPYNKATYLGHKKVLNVGVGAMVQSKAMRRISEDVATDTLYEDMTVVGADVFYDSPLNEKGAALTVYGAYNYCDYGKNYLRMLATPNPAVSGTGSGFYGIGTGDIFYAQVGYLLNRSKNEEKKARTQFYVSTEIASLRALKTPMIMYEAGVNYYFVGTHGPKLTLGYQDRSVFRTEAGEKKQIDFTRKGMVVLQLQISF